MNNPFPCVSRVSIGLVNGFMATKLKLPSFQATSLALSGTMLVYTGGSPKGATPAAFRIITEGWLGLALANVSEDAPTEHYLPRLDSL